MIIVLTNKLDQAEYIQKNGCSDLSCNSCQFITGTCRIFKPDTDPDIIKNVNIYLRKEKLKLISNNKKYE